MHSIRRLLRCDSAEFAVAHVTGDLWQLTPTDCFAGFDSGFAVVVPLIVEYWQIFETDIMPRWYVAAPGAAPTVLRCMETEDPRGYSAAHLYTTAFPSKYRNLPRLLAKMTDIPVDYCRSLCISTKVQRRDCRAQLEADGGRS